MVLHRELNVVSQSYLGSTYRSMLPKKPALKEILSLNAAALHLCKSLTCNFYYRVPFPANYLDRSRGRTT